MFFNIRGFQSGIAKGGARSEQTGEPMGSPSVF
jgi:hypothetical protein